MGTSVAAGTGQAVVVATPMKTEPGRLAGLIAEAGADDATPLEQKLESFSRVLVRVTGCVILGLPAPRLPIHLLWINLVTDGLPAWCWK